MSTRDPEYLIAERNITLALAGHDLVVLRTGQDAGDEYVGTFLVPKNGEASIAKFRECARIHLRALTATGIEYIDLSGRLSDMITATGYAKFVTLAAYPAPPRVDEQFVVTDGDSVLCQECYEGQFSETDAATQRFSSRVAGPCDSCGTTTASGPPPDDETKQG